VRLHTLQYLLKLKLATTVNYTNSALTSLDAASSSTNTTPVTIRAAITVVSAAPIVVIYPFLQRYFVVGLNVGSVKG
jgi:putative aldouronate transport system permease protein